MAAYRLTIAALSILLAAPSLAAAPLRAPAQQSASDRLRVSALEGGRLQLTQGRLGAVVNIGEHVSGCRARLYDGASGEQYGLGIGLRVVDEVQKGGFWYLVLQINSGPSCNVQAECGAGNNTDVLWLKLNRRLHPVARQAWNLEHCLTGRSLEHLTGIPAAPPQDLTPLLELRRGVLALTTVDAHLRTTLLYDHCFAERGLRRVSFGPVAPSLHP